MAGGLGFLSATSSFGKPMASIALGLLALRIRSYRMHSVAHAVASETAPAEGDSLGSETGADNAS